MRNTRKSRLGRAVRGRALLASTVLFATLATGAARAQSARTVDITFTARGVPHVVASDFFGLGYGYAYALAKIDFCSLAEVFVDAEGRRAQAFGAGGASPNPLLGKPADNVAGDLANHLLLDRKTMAFEMAGLSPRARALVSGYAAGFNRYLRDTPADRRPKACRGADWTRPVTAEDVVRRAAGAALLTGFFDQELVDARPPGADQAATLAQQRVAVVEPADVSGAGSNGYAFGGEATGNGRGLLLGNPHWFWQPTSRLVQAHLTIPGRYDVMGASVVGIPAISIGFNRSLAWTHTVATDARGTIYELALDPRDQTRYLVDGVSRPMQREAAVADVRGPDGRVTTVRHVFWLTEFGPVIASRQLPWTRTHAYALADADARNNRYLDQILDIGSSHDVRQLKARLAKRMGLFWLNTIAADSRGEALYADYTVVPNVPKAVYEACVRDIPIAQAKLVKILDGSRSLCRWRDDPRAVSPGIMPAEDKPSRLTRRFVGNSNSSHWVVDDGEPITGYSPIIGQERKPPNLRTRQGELVSEQLMAGRAPDTSPEPDMKRLEALLFSNRDYFAELVLDDLLATCERQPVATGADGRPRDLRAACDVLARWDRKDDLDSIGAQLFREFARLAKAPGEEDAATAAGFWRIPFDPADPIHTPRGLNTATDKPLTLLAAAVDKLEAAGVPFDAPLGKVQYLERNGERIPMHGGLVFNRISLALQPGGYREPMGSADSYIQVVGFDVRGPVADTLVVNSQSADPESPWYADQTRLYSAKSWVRAPYFPDDVKTAAVGAPIRLRISAGAK